MTWNDCAPCLKKALIEILSSGRYFKESDKDEMVYKLHKLDPTAKVDIKEPNCKYQAVSKLLRDNGLK